MSKVKTYMVIEGLRDAKGRAPFSMFWSDPDGVFRPELGKDGKPVGYRRAQCFRAIPEEYIARGAILVTAEAEAKKKAWA